MTRSIPLWLTLIAATGGADPIRSDTAVDLAVTGGATAFWAGSELLMNSLAPRSCRWCDRDLNGLDAGVRRALVWQDTHTAGTLSDVGAFVLAPVAAFGLDALAARHDGVATDWLVIAEAVTLAGDLNQIVKLTVARERPSVHFGAKAAFSSEDNLSFYSGHTSLAFSLAVASGTVASIRGYGLAPLVWGVGLGAAATTGYLRIAADRHYFTDVLTGAVVGSAVGLLVPLAFHRGSADAGGASIASVRWVF